MDTVAQSNKHGKTFKVRLRNLFWRLISVLPDKPYLRLKYATIYGRFPDLEQPRRFSEMQQVRKLTDHRKLYNLLVDKADAKTYIAERTDRKYVIPTYWVGTDLTEVDWTTVPLPAVVKPTHSSGAGFFLRCAEDIEKLMQARPEGAWLSLNHFGFNREWAYKDVPPRIVIEKMLGDEGDILTDYRFYCFNGQVAHVELSTPQNGKMFEAVYTPDWELTPIDLDYFPRLNVPLPVPPRFDEMLEIARKISDGINFARVDLYNTGGNIFVGEITLYPSGGFEIFKPDSYDFELAEYWRRCNADNYSNTSSS